MTASADYPDHPTIDVWAVLEDLAIPDDVVERLLDRKAARAEGRVPDLVPEADKPYLARHFVTRSGV